MEVFDYVLNLGTNLPPRIKNLKQALNALQILNIKNFRCSQIYLSQPYGFLSENSFYNLCCRFESEIPPESLLLELKNIESAMGKNLIPTIGKDGKKKFADRPIDIDILLAGSYVCQTESLTIPHYDLPNRYFFLLPLLEIFPHAKDPITSRAYLEVWEALKKRTPGEISSPFGFPPSDLP